MNYGNPYTVPQMGYTQPVVQPMGIPAHQPQMVTPMMQPVQTVPGQYMPVQPAPVYHQPMPTQPIMTTPMYTQPMGGVPMATPYNMTSACFLCQGRGITHKGKPCKMCAMKTGRCYKCNGSGITRKGKTCKICAMRRLGGYYY